MMATNHANMAPHRVRWLRNEYHNPSMSLYFTRVSSSYTVPNARQGLLMKALSQQTANFYLCDCAALRPSTPSVRRTQPCLVRRQWSDMALLES